MIGHNNPNRALIAAASDRKLDSIFAKVGENWQAELWDIYEALAPVHYGMGFKRNAAQKVTYFVAEKPEGADEPEPTTNAQAVDAFDRLESFPDLVGELVVHGDVAGEGYLVGQERDSIETWQVWSTIEVNEAQKWKRKDPDDVEPLRDDDVTIRIWRPSPRQHSAPDSSLRSVQAQCAQLLLLNEQIGATAMSRLPAGLLLIPEELSFAGSSEEGPDTGANADGDPFTDELIQMLTTAIKDSDSAARVAPGVVRGASEFLKEVRVLDFGREMDETFAAMREELLRMIAAGIDLPPEILLGKADLNHWSSWDVDESAAKLHVDPGVLWAIDGITQGYLWPALEEAGMGREQAREFQIWRDYSELTSRPVSVDQGIALYDRSVITAGELKRIASIANADEDIESGDIAHYAESIGVLFRAGFEPEAILSAFGLPSIEHSGVAPVTVQSEDAVDDVPDVESPAGPENVDRTPPVTAAAGISLEPLARVDNSLAERIIEASEAAFARALERAGAKVRAKIRKDRQASALIDGLDNSLVTKTLGAERVESFQLTEDQLVPADTFEPLAARLERILAQGQEQTNDILRGFADFVYNDRQATEERSNAIAVFISTLIGLVTARLFTDAPEPDPADTGEISDTVTTGQQVFQLLTQAGGGGLVETFTPESPRGLALGARTRAILADNGYVTESQTWDYGPAIRRTFEPHRALAGESFVDLQSPRLLVSPSYSWIGVSHYFPGDHRGCLCALVPTVLPTEGVE